MEIAAGKAAGEGGGRPAVVADETVVAAHVVVDVADGCAAEAAPPAEEQQQQVGGCRICHLGDGDLPDCGAGRRLVRLGCGCRGELAAAHSRCAEAWFSVRGNRRCEICGENAVNITCRGGLFGRGGGGGAEFMRQWHGGTAGADGGGGSPSACGGFCRTQSLCNLLFACVILMIILPWFFRYDII